jgi:hypothetical protein
MVSRRRFRRGRRDGRRMGGRSGGGVAVSAPGQAHPPPLGGGRTVPRGRPRRASGWFNRRRADLLLRRGAKAVPEVVLGQRRRATCRCWENVWRRYKWFQCRLRRGLGAQRRSWRSQLKVDEDVDRRRGLVPSIFRAFS